MPSKQREKSEATKKKLMECAEKLFYKKGFDRTSVKEIVKAAGVAQGTFYLYFETKDEILFTIIKNMTVKINNCINILDIKNPKLEDIEIVVDYIAAFMKDNPEIIKLVHNARIIELAGFEKHEMKTVWFFMDMIGNWIYAASEKGIIGKIDPVMYSNIIFQIVHELLETAFLYNTPADIDVMKEETKKIVKSILVQ